MWRSPPPMPEAARTLVKSPPELWAEVSDPDALARHLGGVGEIRITRLEPEATVAWEGDRVRGTVDLEPAGWGTKVTVTAETAVTGQPPGTIALLTRLLGPGALEEDPELAPPELRLETMLERLGAAHHRPFSRG